ncbi:uncharacterized protein [Typha latifolia]|uniref:uncharacterized protein n=1 Tax=Typha latifolia TaxID=4733 RepID=UPI003C2CCC13
MDRRSPLPVSHRRLRPRPVRTPPPASSTTEAHFPELAAMAKGVTGNREVLGTETSPLFERGRLYELYSARRNERLKRKKRETAEEKVAQEPPVAVELAKRRNWKNAEGVRRSAPGRSRKEMKKVTVLACAQKSSVSSTRLDRRI